MKRIQLNILKCLDIWIRPCLPEVFTAVEFGKGTGEMRKCGPICHLIMGPRTASLQRMTDLGTQYRFILFCFGFLRNVESNSWAPAILLPETPE